MNFDMDIGIYGKFWEQKRSFVVRGALKFVYFASCVPELSSQRGLLAEARLRGSGSCSILLQRVSWSYCCFDHSIYFVLVLLLF